MNGEILKIDPISRKVSVEIDGEIKIFSLASHIDDKFVKLGEASFTAENGVITFIKMKDKSPSYPKKTPFEKVFQKADNYPSYRQRDPQEQKLITKEWAINAAIQIFMINKDKFEGVVLLDQIKQMAKELKAFAEEEW